MREVLETAVDPLDASLEKVLPGVQQWHATHHQCLTRMTADYQEFKQSTAAQLHSQGQVMNQIANRQQQQMEQFRAAFENAALAFSPSQDSVGGGASNFADHPIPPFNLEEMEEPQEPMLGTFRLDNNGAPVLESDQTAEGQRGYEMHPRKSLHEVYEEWYGLGDFDDGMGGVAGRDKKFGNKWRKHVESNHYSRSKGVVAAIEECSKQKRILPADACSELQMSYLAVKCSIGLFRSHCQNIGLLPKGKRRGRKSKNTSNVSVAVPPLQ